PLDPLRLSPGARRNIGTTSGDRDVIPGGDAGDGEILLRAAIPTITPRGGMFTGLVTVTLATATPDAAIYYTIDGGQPTRNSTRYLGPFTLTADTRVRAIAGETSLLDSFVASAQFTLNVPPPPQTVATPTINPNGGAFVDPVQITLETQTAGAQVRYTVD